jgi:hypothetical protein
MNRAERAQNWLKEALFENLALKLVSLVCALGFFVFTRGAEQAERRVDLGVAVIAPPESANRVLVKEPPTEISVTLSGTRAQLDSLPRDLGTVQLDLSTGFESVVELTPSMIPNLVPGVAVAQIFPGRIEVRWDDVVTRELPVQIARTGEPAQGFSIRGAIMATPQAVHVSGPRSVVDLLQVARSAPFDVTGLEEGYHARSLALELPPNGVSYVEPSINATVQVAREERVVPVKGVSVEVVGAPRASTKPAVVTVKLRGVPEVVESIEPGSLVPRVMLPEGTDLSKPSSALCRVIIDVPSVEATVEPAEVLVKW